MKSPYMVGVQQQATDLTEQDAFAIILGVCWVFNQRVDLQFVS